MGTDWMNRRSARPTDHPHSSVFIRVHLWFLSCLRITPYHERQDKSYFSIRLSCLRSFWWAGDRPRASSLASPRVRQTARRIAGGNDDGGSHDDLRVEGIKKKPQMNTDEYRMNTDGDRLDESTER